MPIEVGIWRINDELERINFSSIQTEKKLEEILVENLGILDPGLLLIGSQISTDFEKLIDLLAVDSQGDLVVIELKRNRTPREVVAQLLDYASWVQSLTYDKITFLYSEKHGGEKFEQAFSEQFGIDPPETLNENHRLIVVASELDNSTERIIDYLSSGFGVPINKEPAVRVKDFYVQSDGMEKPILEMPLKASKMAENADDEELSEYLVRIEWIKSVPLERALWEKGMFANQNSACKLRNKFTLERLNQLLNLDDE
jgi:hypothetical protein